MQFLFPFEKNRYFPHKRMRSADFSRELAYMDHKFQFLGRWIFGTGPACGLEVQRLDSDSLLISPGMAVDDLGRCIIVDEPAICRIRTLPGFDDLNGETALLWLSYREELKDPVTVAGEQEEQQEYTVCAERYTFALSDMSFLPPDAVDASLYSRSMMFEDETLHIEQVIPRVLSAQHPSKIRLILQNFSLDTITVRILYQPELPGFCMENGEKRLCWEQCVKVPCGFISIDLTVVPDTTARSAPFTLSSDGLTVQIQGRKRYAKSSFYEELKLTQRDPLEVLSAQLSSLSLQQLYGDEECRGIPIAGIRFLRYDDGFLLDDVVPLYERYRAHFPAITQRLHQCSTFFPSAAQPDAASAQKAVLETHSVPAVKPNPRVRHMTTGVVTLQEGLHLQAGKILYSNEIMHRLGPGSVYVDFGIEHIYPSVQADRNSTDLLFGDVSLFVQSSGSYEQNLDKGIRIHPDKGTFELAVRIKEPLHQSALHLRWFAWRTEEEVEQPITNYKLIRLEPSVAYVKPGEVIHFVPIFEEGNMPCEFFVPEKQAGLITRDGIYTAPEREGLYQVCAQILEKPETRISAFVIVQAVEEGMQHAAGNV